MITSIAKLLFNNPVKALIGVVTLWVIAWIGVALTFFKYGLLLAILFYAVFFIVMRSMNNSMLPVLKSLKEKRNKIK